jgi:CrcB protein
VLRFWLICLGGAVGTAARYGLQTWAKDAFGPTFPWGTLGVNLIGSFLISLIMVVGLETQAMSVTTRMALVTGVMGGFTTYSSFNYETMGLLLDGSPKLAAANVAATLLGCWIAGALGYWVGKKLVGGTVF